VRRDWTVAAGKNGRNCPAIRGLVTTILRPHPRFSLSLSFSPSPFRAPEARTYLKPVRRVCKLQDTWKRLTLSCRLRAVRGKPLRFSCSIARSFALSFSLSAHLRLSPVRGVVFIAVVSSSSQRHGRMYFEGYHVERRVRIREKVFSWMKKTFSFSRSLCFSSSSRLSSSFLSIFVFRVARSVLDTLRFCFILGVF